MNKLYLSAAIAVGTLAALPASAATVIDCNTGWQRV
jgi:hypothetical protein